MTKTDFNKLLLRTDEKYRKCWEVLATLKTKPDESIQLFQSMLCEALFDLSNGYRAISQRRKKLISRKHKLSPAWFSKQQKLLASRQDSIVEASAIGRTMGDSFAWLFYRNDLDLIEQHLKHYENSHIPPGFGGIGEKEFISRVRRIGDFMILYHGTTSILRLGDVSLIDLKSFRVAGIGELKTTPKKPGELSIALLITGHKEHLPAKSLIKISASQKTDKTTFPPPMKARLERQIDRNVKALSSTRTDKDGSKIDIRVETYIPEFEKMLREAKVGKFSYRQFGPGLLCIVFKQKRRRLSSVLSPNKQIDFASKLDELPKHAIKIAMPGSPHNSLNIDSLVYGRNGTTRFQLGTLPVFWWPLEADIIKKLIFQEYIVDITYNPAHFIAKLAAAGFTVASEDGSFSLYHTVGKKKFYVTGLPYFLSLICFYLYKEEEVIEMLKKSITAIDDAGVKANTKCEFRFDHRLFM